MLPTKDKYHILFIYTKYEDDYCEGCYYIDIDTLRGCGGVSEETFDKMYEKAYESLQHAVEGEDDVPFDINNIKKSVAFDFVECHNMDEAEAALEFKEKGKNFEELNNIIQE